MSECNPTPGPWKVEAPGLADEGTRAILSPSGDCLARLSAGGNGPHLASNANLIASAHDLLRAIRDIAAETTKYDSEEIIANIQGICATTLAKVEGRTK